MSINQIVTPLDSAVLETKEQYMTYFKIVKHAFNELVEKIANEKICTQLEASVVMQYGELLTYSLEAFRVKYLFDEDEKMRVDLTESGFPNYLEFRYLYNDLELKHEHISKLPKLEKVRAEFLETLIKNKEAISDRKMYQAASIIYYTSVDKQYIFRRFVQGRILEVTDKDEQADYMVSWSFYDVVTNRPFICFMYFDLLKVSKEEYKEEIYKALENTADRDMPIDMMAYAIDKKLDYLLPKKIKKFDLGPLHSVFAKDELEITHTILQAIVEKTFDLMTYAISISVEEAISTGSFTEGGFFNKQQLQVWEKQRLKKYLFCSHRVMQSLYDNIPETVNKLTQDPIEIRSLKLN